MGNKLNDYVDLMAFHNEVTGSMFLCSVKLPTREKVKFLVDAGLFQEEEYLKYNDEILFDCSDISFVLVTHNHVDHTGRLPLITKNGFDGNIYTSKGTQTLLPLSLFDSESHLSEMYKRRHKKPLYNETDVKKSLEQVIGVDYNKKIQITPNISAIFIENAHIPGASMIFVEITYPGEEPINLFFTGDYAPHNDFLEASSIPDEILNKRLTIIVESTYGAKTKDEIEYGYFKEKVSEAIKNEKTVIIPALSQMRSQKVLWELKKMKENGEIGDDIPIFFDGNLAHSYTRLYLKNNGLIKDEMRDFLPENVIFVNRDIRELLLNSNETKIIVTTSGMGSHGPAQVYIPHYILDKNCVIMFTCFCVNDTVGAKLKAVKQGEKVNIYGMVMPKKAEVLYTEEFSSHAKQEELLELLKSFKDLKAVIINHGESKTKEIFAEKVYDEINTKSVGIINRDYLFRIGSYGVEKTMSTKFIK